MLLLVKKYFINIRNTIENKKKQKDLLVTFIISILVSALSFWFWQTSFFIFNFGIEKWSNRVWCTHRPSILSEALISNDWTWRLCKNTPSSKAHKKLKIIFSSSSFSLVFHIFYFLYFLFLPIFLIFILYFYDWFFDEAQLQFFRQACLFPFFNFLFHLVNPSFQCFSSIFISHSNSFV